MIQVKPKVEILTGPTMDIPSHQTNADSESQVNHQDKVLSQEIPAAEPPVIQLHTEVVMMKPQEKKKKFQMPSVKNVCIFKMKLMH